jgi:hypothetical protein
MVVAVRIDPVTCSEGGEGNKGKNKERAQHRMSFHWGWFPALGVGAEDGGAMRARGELQEAVRGVTGEVRMTNDEWWLLERPCLLLLQMVLRRLVTGHFSLGTGH